MNRHDRRRAKKTGNIWANYNGPGKGITQEQIRELCAQWGIPEHYDAQGNGYYKREDFEPIWALLGIGTKQKPPS